MDGQVRVVVASEYEQVFPWWPRAGRGVRQFRQVGTVVWFLDSQPGPLCTTHRSQPHIRVHPVPNILHVLAELGMPLLNGAEHDAVESLAVAIAGA